VSFAASLQATTYIVPSDGEMIAAAQGIVSGTVIDTYCRRAADGTIETVTELRVDERFKGVDDTRTLTVVQWGGQLGDEWMQQSDAPVLARGELVLLFLTRNRDGDWTPYAIALGAFHFVPGHDVLVRSSIVGWSADGAAYPERPRLEQAFLAYVRATCAGERPAADYFTAEADAAARPVRPNATFTSAGYGGFLGGFPARRQDSNLNIAWRPIGTQPGLDLNAALDYGNGQWDGQSPKITYTRGATASGDTRAFDSEHRLIASDPHNDIPGTFSGAGVVGTTFSFGGGTFAFNGDTFKAITHSDIVMNDGVDGSNVGTTIYNLCVAHELGHTLGLRHANQDQSLTAACTAPLDCCINTSAGGNCKAVMQSNLVSLPGLQQWDRDAIGCLYGAACASDGICTPPSIATQPQNKSIVSGTTTSLSVVAGGTGPFTYQWYLGNPGNTATPTGSNSATLAGLSPASATSYWVRVTGQCGVPVDSNTATITVTTPCANVIVQSATARLGANGQATLSANAFGGSGITYTWFRGDTPGSGGTQIGTGTPLVLTVTQTTTFWVRARNSCGNSSVSALITVAITGPPVQPRRRAIRSL
jgi:hypothetical protein